MTGSGPLLGEDQPRTAAFDGLNPPYSTIVADPPWPYETSKSGSDSGDQT